MKDSHDVGPVCSRFVQGDDIVVSEHYDSVSIICLCMVSLPGPWGSLLLLGEDAMYGASSVHRVQLNNKSSFDVYTSHTISLLLNTHNRQQHSQQWDK